MRENAKKYRIHASMGPPLFRAESDQGPAQATGRSPASMGPPLFRAESAGPAPDKRPARPRFNGAALIQGGKQTCPPGATPEDQLASMGPPLFRAESRRSN